MTKDEIRMKLWCDVYASLAGADRKMTIFNMEHLADEALVGFDNRFPAESSEDEPKTVWVTFWDDEPDESYGTLYEANNACEVLKQTCPATPNSNR